MSVPAINAAPPAPRRTATRTDADWLICAQASASPSYIAQVIALRAAGRSKVIWAMAPATRNVTWPSVGAVATVLMARRLPAGAVPPFHPHPTRVHPTPRPYARPAVADAGESPAVCQSFLPGSRYWGFCLRPDDQFPAACCDIAHASSQTLPGRYSSVRREY